MAVAVASVGLTADSPRFDHIFYFLTNEMGSATRPLAIHLEPVCSDLRSQRSFV